MIHNFAHCSLSTAVIGTEIRRRVHVNRSIGHRNGDTGLPHNRQINRIIPHIKTFIRLEIMICQQFLKSRRFMMR